MGSTSLGIMAPPLQQRDTEHSPMIRVKTGQQMLGCALPRAHSVSNKYAGGLFWSRSASSFNLDRELILYGSKKQTPVSLKSLMETGKGNLLSTFDPLKRNTVDASTASELVLFQVASFLHREIPVRIAHRVEHLQSSPYLLKSESIQKVVNRYKSSFVKLRSAPAPTNAANREAYTKLLESVYNVHSSTLIYVAKGLNEIRTSLEHSRDEFADRIEIQKTFDEFFLSRIGIRMLVAQYLKLCKPQVDPNMIGLVNLKTSPYQLATAAIDDASYICRRTHGDAPEVLIVGRTDLTFPYVPSHLNYVLVELLKNSMRATVETHGVDRMPPIKIVIADGEDNEDVVIKVSDEGGGIKRSNMNRIWSYLYTTADSSALERLLDEVDHPTESEKPPPALEKVTLGSATGGLNDVANTAAHNIHSMPMIHPLRDLVTALPLAGLGYGLPIARNYARYFGGELKIMSMEGYGTDGYIYLPRLSNTDASV